MVADHHVLDVSAGVSFLFRTVVHRLDVEGGDGLAVEGGVEDDLAGQ